MLENHQRQNLYRFFARIFSYPDADLSADLEEELATAAGSLGVPIPALILPLALEEIETGYTDLFISRYGGVPAPPYGSVYLEEDAQLMGQTTLYALRAYEGEGLKHEDGGEPPDFIATEMEFLYFLVGREMEALAREEIEEAHQLRQKQVDFCHTLLQPWIKQFSQRILQTPDAHPLYRGCAELLMDFCRHEEELYGVIS